MRNYLLTMILRTFSPLAILFLATIANADIITNGDFENGDQDFLTDYALGIGVTEQRYNVTTDPNLHHGLATSYGDHTSGSGLMMAVNAATQANQLVWGQEVTLTANTDYQFSIWVSSWYSGAPANLIFDIGGISLGSFVAPLQTAIWEQYSFSFNSGTTSGPVFLSIIDTTRAFGGDDFALDDISLIAVNSEPGALQFSLATYSVMEDGVQTTITVTRTNGSDGAVSVDYATSDGSATAGNDYAATSGTLNWAEDDATPKTFTVDINDDDEVEGDETVILSLGNATNGAILDTPSTATLTIRDNDIFGAGVPQFTNSTVEVAETASTVTLTVRRVGGTNGELTVNYATTDGTATDGSDYVGATGTLTWADGDSNDKTFTVTITDDSLSEGNETFTVSLETLDTATVTIVDNDTTLVTLGSFTATALENSIEIVWVTYTEFDSIGFHLWRATSEGWKYGDYSTVTRLTDQLIPAEGNSGAGATYSYIDSDVESGVTYYYGLEDRDGTNQPTYYLDDIDSATAK